MFLAIANLNLLWGAALTGIVFMTRLVYREHISMQKLYQENHQRGRYRQVHPYQVVAATHQSLRLIVMVVQQKAE